MLLDLGLRFVINPTLYVGTLAIRLETDNRPECGVWSGRHAGFTEEEGNQRMPRFHLVDESPMTATVDYDSLGFYDFVIDRLEPRARENQLLQYHYVALGWDGGVYVQHPAVWTLTLTERTDGWDVSIGRPGWTGLTLILPDYQPGWIQRTGARAL